jgi:broad specificity phosphatase PhoE
VVLTSPLRRAIQTSLAAFSHVLDKRYFEASSGLGVENGVELRLEPHLQERSDLPCDTGSGRDVLKKEFPNLDQALEELSEGWQAKEGPYAADDEAVKFRAARVREKIKKLSVALHGKERRDVVVVTHGVFMKFLSGEGDIDLPKAGWKSYMIGTNEGGEPVLIPVEEGQ